MKKKLKPMYIPNMLSCLRLALVGAFVLVFVASGYEYKNHIALFVFLFAGLTDVIDGFLARRFGWVTTLGKILDPLADKLMQCAVLICLAGAKMIGVWFIIPYILKELLMLFGGLFIIKKKKIVVVSNIFGKFAVVFFYAVIFFVLLLSNGSIEPWVNIMCAISLVFTVIALVAYVTEYFVIRPDKESFGSTTVQEKNS